MAKPFCSIRRTFIPGIALTLVLASVCALAQIGDHRSHEDTGPVPDKADDSIPVFKTESRLVLLDAVVTDSKGNYVSGLKPEDFELIENGKPQKVIAFAEQKPPAPGAVMAKEPPLPPHVYSNFTPLQPGHAATIILLDVLNTTGLDRAYARQQMLKFLQNLPPGQQIALFTMDTQLRLLQTFTADSAELAAAAQKASGVSAAPGVTTDADRQQFAISAFPDSPHPSPNSLLDAISQQDVVATNARAQLTLEHLNALARMLAGYAGRKNLLWLSADFPVRLDNDFVRQFSNEDPQIGRKVQQTEALLAAASIAVYPMSVRGQELEGTSINTASSFVGQLQQETSGIQVTPTAPGSTGAPQTSLAKSQTNKQFDTRYDIDTTIDQLAAETGGRAFHGTNDLTGALTQSLADGSHYYSLAYVPQNTKWDGSYRKLEIKMKTPGLKVHNRKGYYGEPQEAVKGDRAAKLLAAAVQPANPVSTMLFVRARVLPPDATSPLVRIDYILDPAELAATDVGSKGSKHLSIDFLATAYEDNLKVAGHVQDSLDGELKPEVFDAAVKAGGLTKHQDLELKPGKYHLRLGVIDRGTQKIGTLDVPLTVPAPPAK